MASDVRVPTYAELLLQNEQMRHTLKLYANPANWINRRREFSLSIDHGGGHTLAEHTLEGLNEPLSYWANPVLVITPSGHGDEFMSWLDGQGEQDWWVWEEAQGLPQTRLDYNYEDGIVVLTIPDKNIES